MIDIVKYQKVRYEVGGEAWVPAIPWMWRPVA